MNKTKKWKRIKKILLHVDSQPLETSSSLRNIGTVNCVNAYSLALAVEDDLFCDALLKSDILLCDGILISLLCRFFLKKKVDRVTGPEFADYFFEHCSNLGGKRLLYYGSTTKVCSLLEANLINRGTKNIIVVKAGFNFDELDKDLVEVIVGDINSLRPDVVFLGMTAPKQEKLALLLHHRLNVMALVQVGAYFDFTAGSVKKSPSIFSFFGIEWVWRLILQPKKISNRIWYLRKLF